MNNAEIQIQFPSPGQWDQLTLTALYRDAEGYTRADRYTQDDIPADQAPALAEAVTAIARLGEDWQATQVWARLGAVCGFVAGEVMTQVVVELTVEAVNFQGGRRTFTVADYPEFIITDPAAVAFFKHFTNQ